MAGASLACWLVRILHAAFIAFVVLVPFMSRTVGFLVIHAMLVPFLYLHWFLNNDTCALTLLECYLRGCPQDRSFVYNVVGPIYNVDPRYVNAVTRVLPLILWCVTLYRIRGMYCRWRRAPHQGKRTWTSLLAYEG